MECSHKTAWAHKKSTYSYFWHFFEQPSAIYKLLMNWDLHDNISWALHIRHCKAYWCQTHIQIPHGIRAPPTWLFRHNHACWWICLPPLIKNTWKHTFKIYQIIVTNALQILRKVVTIPSLNGEIQKSRNSSIFPQVAFLFYSTMVYFSFSILQCIDLFENLICSAVWCP